MSIVRSIVAIGALCLGLCGGAAGQEPPQPGPEHARLKQLEGTWAVTIKSEGGDSTGTMVHRMELGGLWLVGEFNADFGGAKFSGRGLDTYDAAKKKYVSVWVDSWSTTPLILEGNYDSTGKTLTMTGEGPGPDGKLTKFKAVTTHKDANSFDWSMSAMGADGKENPMLSMTYRRKK